MYISELFAVELEGTTLSCMDPNYWFIVAFCDLHPAAAKQTVPFARCRGGPWSLVLEMETFRDCFWEIVGWNGRFTRKTCSNVLFASICNISCNTSFWESEPNLPNPGGVSCGSKVCSLTIVVLFWGKLSKFCRIGTGKWWKSGGQVWALLAIWQVLGFCFSVLHAKNVAPGIANFEKKHFPNGRG